MGIRDPSKICVAEKTRNSVVVALGSTRLILWIISFHQSNAWLGNSCWSTTWKSCRLPLFFKNTTFQSYIPSRKAHLKLGQSWGAPLPHNEKEGFDSTTALVPPSDWKKHLCKTIGSCKLLPVLSFTRFRNPSFFTRPNSTTHLGPFSTVCAAGPSWENFVSSKPWLQHK